jgi:hypothetical protein
MAKKPAPNRKRPMRMITMNPQLAQKLLDVGHATTGETNLSRLIDAAVAEYVESRWKPRYSRERAAAAD